MVREYVGGDLGGFTPRPDPVSLVDPAAASPSDSNRLDLTDRDQFAAVVREYHRPLAHYALRLTQSAPVASDVVQDVFLRLWERRERIEAGPSFRSLLFTMVRNRALNARRKRQPFEGTDLADVLPEAPHPDPGADEDLDARDLSRHVERWIGALPPRRAEAFRLSREGGLSHAEIAEVMGLSVRTVETHVFQALKTLRAHYDALQGAAPAPGEPV